MRRYSAALLLPLFAKLDVERHERMPFRFMWKSGLALAAHDLRVAFRARQWRKCWRGLGEAALFSWRAAIGALQHHWALLPNDSLYSN
ncbi:MAG: hypothetical protein JO002_11540 [Burkholderiaceae bacterium]|nr:hypothetical protein [Burkholderiaceae bacterium]